MKLIERIQVGYRRVANTFLVPYEADDVFNKKDHFRRCRAD